MPTSSTKDTSRRKMIFWVIGIFMILVLGYFIQTTFSFYTSIQNGEVVDLTSFEEGGISESDAVPVVENISNEYVERFEDDPSIGPKDAALTVVLFEDFECPFCGELFPILREVINEYQDSVRFVYRDFPLNDIHANAQKAAEAGQCAHEQGQFWSYHDKLYLNQNALAVADLKRYAQQLNLDTEAFDNCLDTSKYKKEVEEDLHDGYRAGVTGTPTLFFNGNKVSGVLTKPGFEQIITYFENNE